jgi:integrase
MAPVGQGLTAAAVGMICRRAFARAGLPADLRGAHILRRTAATGMVRAGVPLKDVADILRHRNLNTVMIYTKVDLPTLAEVALPWPDVRA